jgi:hypothetical protein
VSLVFVHELVVFGSILQAVQTYMGCYTLCFAMRTFSREKFYKPGACDIVVTHCVLCLLCRVFQLICS